MLRNVPLTHLSNRVLIQSLSFQFQKLKALLWDRLNSDYRTRLWLYMNHQHQNYQDPSQLFKVESFCWKGENIIYSIDFGDSSFILKRSSSLLLANLGIFSSFTIVLYYKRMNVSRRGIIFINNFQFKCKAFTVI